MTTTATPGSRLEEMRRAVARIIDPNCWWDDVPPNDHQERKCNRALAKADEIIARLAAKPADEGVREAALAIVDKIRGGTRDGWGYGREECANFVLQFSAPVPPPDGASAQELWHELVEKTDRTSPEEYPEMALITFEELRDFVRRALSPATGAAEPVAQNEIHSSGSGVESKTRKELSADPQSLIAAGNVDRLGVAPGLPDFNSATSPVRGDREAIAQFIEATAASYSGSTVVYHGDNVANILGAQATRVRLLPVQPGAGEREALLKGFMTACSGDGEYQIKIGFETPAKMQAAHAALVRLLK